MVIIWKKILLIKIKKHFKRYCWRSIYKKEETQPLKKGYDRGKVHPLQVYCYIFD